MKNDTKKIIKILELHQTELWIITGLFTGVASMIMSYLTTGTPSVLYIFISIICLFICFWMYIYLNVSLTESYYFVRLACPNR